jgi:hypothetical protein
MPRKEMVRKPTKRLPTLDRAFSITGEDDRFVQFIPVRVFTPERA